MKQREIKFRGQRLDNKEWIYGYLIKTKTGRTFIGFALYVDERDNPSTLKQTFNAIEVIPETVGQFTGLKDKNGEGKEIYKGDIVKQTLGKYIWRHLITTKDDFANTLYAITRYRNFHINDERETEWGDFYVNEGRKELMNHDKYEIIGNRFENKNLLKKGQKNG